MRGRGRPALRSVAAAAFVIVVMSGCSGAPGVRDIGIASRTYSGLPEGMDWSPTDATTAPTADPPLVSLEPTDIEPTGIQPSPETVAPEDLEPSALPDPDFSPRAVWLSGETLAVVTFGSSSCPSAPAALDVTEPGTVDVVLASTGGDVCTADMSATTFEIDDPEGLDPSITYTVTFDGQSESTLEPLP